MHLLGIHPVTECFLALHHTTALVKVRVGLWEHDGAPQCVTLFVRLGSYSHFELTL